MEPQADIALIGLAVMGQNLILNMNDHGYTVVAYNRTVSKVDEFLNKEAKGTKVIGAHSIMPGGSPAAWPHVKEIFQNIAAKVEDGSPCCDWVGENGAGHYVKMVHNGIEYGDMELICEAYQLMKDGLGMTADEMSQVFAEWNKGDLDSFLIEITANILA